MAENTTNPSASAASAGRLALLKQGAMVASFPVGAAPVTIGRDADNTISLPDGHASRKHAVITVQNGIAVIEDLQSHNGTRVNERKVSRRALQPGDAIRIAKTILVYLVDRPPAQIAGWISARHAAGGEMTLPLAERPILIGKAEAADIQVQETGVADFHALIAAQLDAVELIVLAADPPRRIPLKDGAEARLGPLTLRFHKGAPVVPGSAASAPAPPGKKREGHGKREQSVVLKRQCGDATLMGALRDEVERLEGEASSDDFIPLGPLAAEARLVAGADDGSLKLTITRGKRVGETVSVGKAIFTIGSGAECDLVVDEVHVAPKHALIRAHVGKVFIEDLNSPKGTLVNGKTVRRRAIHPGDSLRIGECELLVHL